MSGMGIYRYKLYQILKNTAGVSEFNFAEL